MAPLRPSGWTRAAAVAMASLVLVSLTALPALTHTAGYLGLAVASAAAAGVCTLRSLWRGGVIGRVVAGLLCALGLAVHGLDLAVGLPGAVTLMHRVGPVELASIALDVAVCCLLVLDGLRRSPAVAPRHPYAL